MLAHIETVHMYKEKINSSFKFDSAPCLPLHENLILR